MRVLVFGAAGFAGTHLLEALAQAEHEGIPVGRLSSSDRSAAGVPFLSCDVRDAGAVRGLMAEVRPDAVINLAGIAAPPVAQRDPALAFAVNTLGAVHILEAAAESDHAPRVLVVSSSEVYGPAAPELFPLKEETVLQPAGIYAASKAAADLAARSFVRSKDVDAVCVRPFNHTGPGQSTDFVCPDFATQLAAISLGRKESYLEVGNLDVTRDFSDVRDIVRGYIAALERGLAGEVYNLCTGRQVLVRGMVEELAEIAGVSPEIRTVEARWRPADVPAYWGNASRAAEDLEWIPAIPWRQTLQDLYADCLDRLS